MQNEMNYENILLNTFSVTNSMLGRFFEEISGMDIDWNDIQFSIYFAIFIRRKSRHIVSESTLHALSSLQPTLSKISKALAYKSHSVAFLLSVYMFCTPPIKVRFLRRSTSQSIKQILSCLDGYGWTYNKNLTSPEIHTWILLFSSKTSLKKTLIHQRNVPS